MPVKNAQVALEAVIAGEVDLALVAGRQAPGVSDGSLVNLVSAENSRLRMSPDVPTLRENGIPYDLGARFLIFAPAGIPDEAKAGMATAIEEVLSDPAAKPNQFITKVFGPPSVVTGEALDTLMVEEAASNRQLLIEANE
jgi:tripartite-type tricarboxylate transporter receptor subunit TctC